jgi:FixJ family two-component response regulator
MGIDSVATHTWAVDWAAATSAVMAGLSAAALRVSTFPRRAAIELRRHRQSIDEMPPPHLLRSKLADAPSGLVLAIRLPGPRRLDFQITLFQTNIHIPIIFMTGHGVIDDCKGLKTGSGVDVPTA